MYELCEIWQKISVKKLYRYGKILYTGRGNRGSRVVRSSLQFGGTSHPSGMFSGVVDVATAGYLWVEATVITRKGYSGWYHCGF